MLGMLPGGNDANPAPWAISSEGGLVAVAVLALGMLLFFLRCSGEDEHRVGTAALLAKKPCLFWPGCLPKVRCHEPPQTPVSSSQAAQKGCGVGQQQPALHRCVPEGSLLPHPWVRSFPKGANSPGGNHGGHQPQASPEPL